MRNIISIAVIAALAFAYVNKDKVTAWIQELKGQTADTTETVSTADKTLYGGETGYQVVRVVDGDTIHVDIDGTETTVRMIGVDTPESVNEAHPEKNCEEGEEASAYTKEQLSDAYVWLEYDSGKTDTYGRTLAYIWLDKDGTTMYQDELLTNGYADCMSIEPNTKYADHFAELQEQARNNNAGFWSEDFWND